MAMLRSKLIYIGFVMAFLFLQYCLWFEKGGIRDMQALKQKLASQADQNQVLRQKNEVLLAEIKRIQQGHAAAESKARSELGMIKKGETFYQFAN